MWSWSLKDHPSSSFLLIRISVSGFFVCVICVVLLIYVLFLFACTVGTMGLVSGNLAGEDHNFDFNFVSFA